MPGSPSPSGPATPEAVLLLADERERHPVWCEFGPLPLVRQMLGLTMLSLVMLLTVSVSAEVNTVKHEQVVAGVVGLSPVCDRDLPGVGCVSRQLLCQSTENQWPHFRWYLRPESAEHL